MFNVESGFKRYADEHGKQEAVELVADINGYTRLYTPNEPVTEQMAKPDLRYFRSLFDCNEHFIELSNWGEDLRTLFFMLAGLFLLAVAVPTYGALLISSGSIFDFVTVLSWIAPGGALILNIYLWPILGAPVLFTHLRARYRFNRTTGKVYVLRPDRYGGNVVLDWHRVQAHVNWRGHGQMTPEQLHDPTARLVRQNTLQFSGLLLYWPPLEADDTERKGEEVLWVGPQCVFGESLWQYIRTFMEEGIDAVPVPNEYEWLRKGYSSPAQHSEEVDLDLSRVQDRVQGRAEEGETSLSTKATFLFTFMWAPVHSLGERLCSWPTFPEEWNSDCGQKRRESGLGPQEPLRWVAK